MVTCGGLDCSVCSLLETIQSFLNWLLGISGALAILTVIFAGGVYIFSLGSSEWLEKSKRIFKYAILGFAATLVSFLVFHTALILIGGNESWFKIDCFLDTPQENESQNIERNQVKQKETLNLNLINGSGAQISITDSSKVTKIDLNNFDPNNLLLDTAELKPDQEIKFIATDKNLNSSDVFGYINTTQGFFNLQKGASGPDSPINELLSIKKDEQGNLIAKNSSDEISIDVNDSKSMAEFQDFLKQSTEKLKTDNKSIYVYSDAGQEDYSSGDQDTCEMSSGVWTTFSNKCLSRRAVCGNGDIECTDTNEEVGGCQCPEGYCLQYGKCVGISENTSSDDEDKDGIVDSLDSCPGTPEGEKVNMGDSGQKGCSCSQIPLENNKCPESRCEGANYANYPDSAQDKCVNGKIIKGSCSPSIVGFSQQCQTIQTGGQLPPIATSTPSQTQNWLNSIKNTLNPGSKPNDKINSWENMGTDEGGVSGSGGDSSSNGAQSNGASRGTPSRPSRSSSSSSSDTNSNDSSSTDTGSQSTSGQSDSTSSGSPSSSNTSSSSSNTSSSQSSNRSPDRSSNSSSGGSEEGYALQQKLQKIPEGILANNSGVTPYLISQCMPKLTQAADNLNKIKPGWKIYPMSIFRSDQKQTRMWDNSSQNEKWIARPIARGGRGSGHSFGNALDIKFVDANGKKVSMDAGNKSLLRQVMKDAGMIPYDVEWWHFYCSKPFQPQEHRPR